MFEQRIQEVHGDANKSEITVLDLEGCEATTLEGLSNDFDSVSTLSLANNKLNSLKSFPALKILTNLNLKGNHLEGGLDHLSHCVQLKTLDLSNNQFSTVEQLEPLKNCAALDSLNMAGCPIASTDDYRKAVFAAIPQLTTIDGATRDSGISHVETENGTHKNGDCDPVAVNGEGDGGKESAGVEHLLRDDLEDDDEEYCPEGEEEEDDEIDEDEDDEVEEEEGDYDEDESAEARGVKRKHVDEDPVAHADDSSANGLH